MIVQSLAALPVGRADVLFPHLMPLKFVFAPNDMAGDFFCFNFPPAAKFCLNSTTLGRTATVMWNRGNIPNQSNF